MFPDIDIEGRCINCRRLRFVGDWPNCPHGRPMADAERTLVHQDSIPGGMVLENYGPEPVTVYSHTERRQLMAQRGLELTERFSPAPGTDVDPQGIPNPKGYVDAQTLANGAALILRQQQSQEPEMDLSKVMTFRNELQPDDYRRLKGRLPTKVG